MKCRVSIKYLDKSLSHGKSLQENKQCCGIWVVLILRTEVVLFLINAPKGI